MPAADLVIVNARALTQDPGRPRAGAVAVAGGRIVAVGDTAEAKALAGPRTEVIDAGGATVLPGFVESHMHLFAGAAELDHLSLAGVTGLDRLEAAVKAYADANPGRPFLMAQAAEYTVLSASERITRHHLDRIVPDRPFAMVAHDHHTVWANTRALEAAGLLRGRAVGPGNEIVMGEDGLALGELREMEAFTPVIEASGGGRARLGLSTGGEPDPAPTPGERAADRDVMRRGLAHAAAHGITSIHNMDGNLYQLELLAEIEAEGGLTCRVQVPFHFKNGMDLAMLDKASLMAERYRSPMLRSGLVKVFYDGVLDSWTAVMVEPYADRPGWRGEPLFSPERFAELAAAIDRRGLQIAVHAIGDGAVRAVLDGYAHARRVNGARDSRHRIEHIEVVHPDDIPRFADLGVIASMQPAHPPGAMGLPLEPTVSRIGRDRWPYAYATRTLKDAGARVCFATDWPVSPIDPMSSIKASVTRRPWADGDPEQRLTLAEAFAAYTREGAYAGFAETRVGMLRPGLAADIVVLSADAEAVAPEDLDGVRPLVTVAAGRITYDARGRGAVP